MLHDRRRRTLAEVTEPILNSRLTLLLLRDSSKYTPLKRQLPTGLGVSRRELLGSALCLLAIWLGWDHRLHAQQEFARLGNPDEVFREPSEIDAFSLGFSQGLIPTESLLQRVPAPEDEFAVGIGATGRIPRDRPLSDGPPGEERAPFKSRLFWIPSQAVQGQTGNLAISGEEFDLGYPMRIDEDGIWLALAGVQRLDINTSVVLPDSGLPVPNQLWDLEAGVMHLRDLGDERRVGGMLRVGSPSDQPFAAWRDLTVTFLGFLTVPAREQNAWSFSLFYSPTGQIIYPIPGVAYVWRPSNQLRANLGIPFSLEYKPTETVMFTASYMPLNNVEVLLRQSVGEFWNAYASYRTVSETFLLAHRENDRERTYLFDQRMTLGIQRELGRGWSMDLSTAYVFDRRFFQAEKFSGSRRDELSIDPGVAATLQLMWTR